MSRREQMIKSIKEGNSILLFDGMGGFKQYTLANLEELPSDAELALGNAQEEKKALEAIEKQFEQLQAAKKKLEASQNSKQAEAVAITEKQVAYETQVTEQKSGKKGGKAAKNVVEKFISEEPKAEEQAAEPTEVQE